MSKAALKVAKEVEAVLAKDRLNTDDRDFIYEYYDPAFDSCVTEKGIFFTPPSLAFDAALFSFGQGHIVDVCSGIGMLSYAMLVRDLHEGHIKSITLIEQDAHFLEMSKKLMSPMSANTRMGITTTINFVNGSAWDHNLWTSITSGLTDHRFDYMISNPPYGKASAEEKTEASWMRYQGERELMAIELAWRYSKEGAKIILPPSSCQFQFSGRRCYERRPSSKVARLEKAIPEMGLWMEADGIDGSVYTEEWKNTKITVEVADVTFQEA